MTTFIAIDVETTGLDPRTDRVVEVAVVLGALDTDHLSVLMDTRVNPGCAIPASASAIHSIDSQDVSDAPPFSSPAVVGRLATILATRLPMRWLATPLDVVRNNVVVVGHSLDFDLGFLRAEFLRAQVAWPSDLIGCCTRRWAGAMWPGESRKLTDIADRVGLGEFRAHSALGDATAAARLYRHIMGTMGPGHPDSPAYVEIGVPRVAPGVGGLRDVGRRSRQPPSCTSSTDE